MFCVIVAIIAFLWNEAAGLTCSEAYSCFNETFSSDSDGFSSLYCYALASCGQSTIANWESGGKTACGASQSCQKTKSFRGSATYAGHIYGFLGLAWSEYVDISDNIIIGYGEASLYSIEQIIGYSYACNGVNACKNINGYGNEMELIAGYGMFSFQNSLFYGKSGSSVTTVYLYGYYSGYNSTFYCPSGQVCSVYCYVNGCDNFNFICNASDGSTCNVYNCDESNGVSCPNGWGNDNNNNNNSVYSIESIISSIDVTEGYLLSYLNEDYANYEDLKVSDNYYENECSIHCGDYQDSSCYTQSFFQESDICCSGTESCYDATLTSVTTIYCDGSLACATSAMVSNNDIRCRGRYACQSSNVAYFNSIIITCATGCQSCSITNGYYVGCFAYQSCSSAIISKVEYVVASGRQALQNGDITSNGIGIMNIYLLGGESGYGLSITCNNNDTCNIYCYNNDTWNDISTITCDNCYKMEKYLLFDDTLAPSAAPSVIPTKAPSNAPSLAPSAAPSTAPFTNPTEAPNSAPTNGPSIAPSLAPSDEPSIRPTKAPTDSEIEYTLSLIVSVMADSTWDEITFYVKLEGTTGDDTDWEEITIARSMIDESSNEQQLNFSVSWDNVGKPDVLTMVALDVNDILFDCFGISYEENSQSFSDAVCTQTTSYKISMNSSSVTECAYASIDFTLSKVKIKISDETNSCPYATVSVSTDNDNNNEVSSGVSTFVTYIVYGLTGIGIFLVVCAFIYTKYIHDASDPASFVNIMTFFLHLGDFWSDIGLTFAWFMDNKIGYFASSACFLVASTVISEYGAFKATQEWIAYEATYQIHQQPTPSRLSQYTRKYRKLILGLSLIAGFKSTMNFLQSKLFYKEIFYIPLKEDELSGLYRYQMATIFVETVPQFGIQLIYMYFYGIGDVNSVSLLLVSIVLSALSIIIHCLLFLAHWYEKGNDNKHFENKQEFDLCFVIRSKAASNLEMKCEIKKYHAMAYNKIGACLYEILMSDRDYPWTDHTCRLECQVYYIKKIFYGIEIHFDIKISSNNNKTGDIDDKIRQFVIEMFDQETETQLYKQFKRIICKNLKLSRDMTKIVAPDRLGTTVYMSVMSQDSQIEGEDTTAKRRRSSGVLTPNSIADI